MATSMYKIFEDNQYSLENAKNRSKTWFDQQALLIRRKRYTPTKVLRDDSDTLSRRMLIGRMYMFLYNPKTKEELPYYDMFPLIFPFKVESDGFYGINLHYLPYFMRIRLLDRMMTFSTNRKMDETTRLKLTWELLNGSTKFAAVKIAPSIVASVTESFPSAPAVTFVPAR